LAGVYIHIPFCRRKCHYCNFFSLASQKLKEPFLQALKNEIELTRDYLSGEPLQTIYFGGGTPSVFGPEVLQEVMELVVSPAWQPSPPDPSPGGEGRNVTAITKEVTLELNPEDVTEEYVAGLKDTWFNRFSLGVQSFFEEDLVFLNRSHSAGKALDAIKLLQESGFENISIDLIYGIPSGSNERWRQNLALAFSLGVPHISAYALTVEPKTPLAWMIENKRSAPVNDELQADQFLVLMQKAAENGFEQYEISNFCKPGQYAMHNTAYWNGIPYLGLGPSAHSYNGSARRWNVASLSGYIEGLGKGTAIREEEILTAIQKYNEYVMTSLRTMWGCDSNRIMQEFGQDMNAFFLRTAGNLIRNGFLTEHSGIFHLTEQGKLFADRVAVELFYKP
jgi:oxygen-independent coproporphyrinogen-3 oxidase